jgi:hypothetical protein
MQKRKKKKTQICVTGRQSVKPVGTSGCIHRYFVLESVVCDGGGTECIAVHMELEILFCLSVLKVPLCCASGHIHAYCLGYALCTPITPNKVFVKVKMY